MVLVVYSIFVLVAGKFQLTPHYGVTGRGARIGGLVCLAVGLGAIQLPFTLLGLSLAGASLVSFLAAFVVIPLTLVILVQAYGNAFAGVRTTTYVPGPAVGPGSAEENRRILTRASRRARRNGILGWALVGLWVAAMVGAPLLAVASGHAGAAGVAALATGITGTVPGLLGLLALLRAQGIRGDIAVVRRVMLDAATDTDESQPLAGKHETVTADGRPARPRSVSAALAFLGFCGGLTVLVTVVHMQITQITVGSALVSGRRSFVLASLAITVGLILAASVRRRWAYVPSLVVVALFVPYVWSATNIALAGSDAAVACRIVAWCVAIGALVLLLRPAAREWYGFGTPAMKKRAGEWREDPYGRHDWRFWNGTAWTEYVADAGLVTSDPIGATPHDGAAA